MNAATQRTIFARLLRYVLGEYVRSGTPLIGAGGALAVVYPLYIGLDFSTIPATYFAVFAALLLGGLGAVSTTLLCRRAATARGLTVLAHLGGRSTYLLARLCAAAIVDLCAFVLSTAALLLVFQRRIEPVAAVLLVGALCCTLTLMFAIGIAAIFSTLATPYRYRVALLLYLALLATALVSPGDAVRTALSPALLPALPLIGALRLASQRARPDADRGRAADRAYRHRAGLRCLRAVCPPRAAV